MQHRSPAGLAEYRTHYRWAVIVITVLFLGLFYRFFLLQIVRGGEYRQDQVASRQRSERIPAPRGQILDRNGEILARNVETHDLVMRPLQVRRPEQVEELLRKLLRLDDHEDATLRELIQAGMEDPTRFDKIVVRRDLVSDYCPFDSAQLEPLEPKKKTLWCSQCGRSYTSLPAGAERCPREDRHKLKWNEHHTGAECHKCDEEFVASTSCPHDGAPLRERTYSLQCPECSRVFNNEKAIIEASLYQMPGVSVETSSRRVYPHKRVAAHVLGYMNEVTAKDLAAEGATFAPGDRIGRSGVERALESSLRGTWGRRHTIVDRPRIDGPIVEKSDPERPDEAMVEGLSVRLTIDLELQRLLRRALKFYRSGAAVLMDVHTGEILAIYSKPGFDPNIWSGRLSPEVYAATRQNPYSPLINKALTAYAPGSVYKIVAAIAGLHTHTLKGSSEILCPGYYEFGGHRFRCHNRTGHGHMNVVNAVARSCDVYFYRLGEMLGIDGMKPYANEFGFGVPTGIEVAEAVGVVPDKDWHRKNERVWMPGFALSTAVGQKDVRSTPLQVARAYAAFANGGKLLEAHLVKQIENSHGDPIVVTQPKVEAMLPMTPEEAALVGDGFWRVLNDEHGTAFNARIDGIEVSGKTGTAEAAESKAGVSEEIATWLKDDHAWFAGYAPSRQPEVSIVVFLEHGHSGGKAAAPIAMRILQAYFARKTPRLPASHADPKLPNPVTPEHAHPPEPHGEPPAPAPALSPLPERKPPPAPKRVKPERKRPDINTEPIDIE